MSGEQRHEPEQRQQPPDAIRQMWLYDNEWLEADADAPVVRLVTAQRIAVNVLERPRAETADWVFRYSQETRHIGREGVRFFETEREALEAAFADMAPQAHALAMRRDVSQRALAARSLYASLGFESYGIERHALKLGDRYLDEELLVLWLHSAA